MGRDVTCSRASVNAENQGGEVLVPRWRVVPDETARLAESPGSSAIQVAFAAW